MIRNILCMTVLLAWSGHFAMASVQTLYVFDARALEAVAKEENAMARLIERAEQALRHPIRSVTHKKGAPASGDARDYYSLAPYWWPDPALSSGIPYIRRDGKRNPDIAVLAGDNHRLRDFSKDVTTLALAFHLTGNCAYASAARVRLNAWFTDPATRMNPNLQHAQAIPGHNDGRGIGIIEGRFLIPLVDAVTMLGEEITAQERAQIRQWFADMNRWLLTSDNGFEEDNWHNNHGTWFDAQVAAFSLFAGDFDTAKRRLRITQMRRIGSQFDREGRQHAEFERTRPWHYANFNLEAYNLLGRLGETAGVDVWNYTVDGHSLRGGYSLVAQMVLQPAQWPYQELYGMELSAAFSTMYAAQQAYDDPLFQQAFERITRENSEALSGKDPRLWPLTL